METVVEDHARGKQGESENYSRLDIMSRRANISLFETLALLSLCLNQGRDYELL